MKKITLTLLAWSMAAVLFAAREQLPSQIQVKTDPSGAAVYCDGKSFGNSPTLLPGLKAGSHIVVAEKDGYRTARETVSVSEGERAPLNIKLQQVSALVIIHTDPEGAEVEIDGVSQGTTPVLITNLTPGKYRVKLQIPGFQAKEVELNAPNRTPVKLSVSLNSDSAKLTIDSTPSNATVTLNGIAKGNTPVTLDRIPAGNVTLELAAPGCAPYKQILTLSAGQDEDITAVLKAIPATLKVVSIPDKARIYIDNQFKGETPLTITDLPPATYKVRAEKRGYTVMPSRSLTLKGAQETTEEFRLTKNAGTMQVTTEPAGVKIFVDGEEVGVTQANSEATDRISEPLVLDFLGVGSHKVQLTRTGYYKIDLAITIKKDETVTKHVPLRRMFIKNYTVRTRDATYEGMLLGKTLIGGIKIEIRPGIVKTLQPADIISHSPLRKDDIDNPN
jgi:hypothetical protein